MLLDQGLKCKQNFPHVCQKNKWTFPWGQAMLVCPYSTIGILQLLLFLTQIKQEMHSGYGEHCPAPGISKTRMARNSHSETVPTLTQLC